MAKQEFPGLRETLQKPFTRRALLGGVVLGASTLACGPEKPRPTPTPAPESTRVSSLPTATAIRPPDVTPVPEIPKPKEINSGFLTSAFKNLTESSVITYAAKSADGTDSTSVKDLVSKSSVNWNRENMRVSDLQSSPVSSLEALLSLTVLGGLENDTVDFTPTSDALKDFRMPRVTLSNTGGKTEETFTNTTPPGWTVRKDAHLVVIGTYTDRNNVKQALVSVDDSLRKPKEVTLSIASVPLTLDQTKEGETSLTDLLKASGTTLDTDKGTVTLPSGKETLLNTIDSGLVDLILNQAGGIYFMDKDPLKKNPDKTPVLNENPVVPYPKVSEVPSFDKVAKHDDGRVLAYDKDGKPVARARYYPWKNQWEWKETDKLNYSLRELADARNKVIGVFIDPAVNIDKDLVADEFNLIQPGAFGWGWLYRDGFDKPPNLDLARKWLSFAKENGQKVRLHPLVYDNYIPASFGDTIKTPKDAVAFLEGHITALFTAFPDVDEVLCVNEAVWATKDGATGYSNGPLYRLLGPSYVETVFTIAQNVRKKLGAKMKLIYNDYGHETPGPKADVVFSLVSDLKQKGLIDMVGFQDHVTGNLMGDGNNLDPLHFPALSVLSGQLDRYIKIGVNPVITECDVDESQMTGTQEQKDELQGNIFSEITELSDMDGCEGMTLYGYNSGDSWLIKKGGKSPLPFDGTKRKVGYYDIGKKLASGITQYSS